MSGKGTTHHKLRSLSGLITIIALPFFLWVMYAALPLKEKGVMMVMGLPLGAISLIVFLTAALFYCKMEMDEVILDYLNGGTQKMALWANMLLVFAAWAAAIYVIVTTWLGA